MAWIVPSALALMTATWIAAVITRLRPLNWTVVGIGAALAVSHAIGLWA
jgi:hypothetical protein